MGDSVIIQLDFQNGIYQGETIQNNKKQGLGIYLWENGYAYYGEWKLDEIDGQGILFMPPDIQIMGHFKQSKMNGKCILSTTKGIYYGEWIKGQPFEKITAYLQNQEVTIFFEHCKPIKKQKQKPQNFEIPILDNKIVDQKAIQQLELENGTFYGITSKSKLNKMQPNGLGIFISVDGLYFCGQFKDGIYNGIGRLLKQNGEMYVGEFQNGQYDGKGYYLSKNYEMQWTQGIWKQGILVSVIQNGLQKDSVSQEIMFPFSNHQNPKQVYQPTNVNEIKQFEEQIIDFLNKSQYSSAYTSPDLKKNHTKLTRNYFSNSPKTSYKQITEALFGLKKQEEKLQKERFLQNQQKKYNQLIQYYKDQSKLIESSSKVKHLTNQFKKNQISHTKMKTHFIESQNIEEYLNGQSNSNCCSPFRNQEIKYLQMLQKVDQPYKQNSDFESERIHNLKKDPQVKPKQGNPIQMKKKQEQLYFQQLKTQDSPKIFQNSLISKTERNKSFQKSSNSCSKNQKNNQQLKKQQDDIISTKNDNNKMEYSNKLKSSSNRKNNKQPPSSQREESKQYNNKIKLNNYLQKEQEQIDLGKKISFGQLDFALNCDTFKGLDLNQDQQNSFHKIQKSIAHDNSHFDQTQAALIERQQKYLEQIIDQQKQQLENLKIEQKLLDKGQLKYDNNSKIVIVTNGSNESLDSIPHQTDSFNQDFLKSVKDILKFELKRKQGGSIQDSPNFEQSKITNNQQSLFSNDIQSLENVHQFEKLSSKFKIQYEDHIEYEEKKQIDSQKDLDDLFFDNNTQTRQARRTKSSKLSMQKNQLANQSNQHNQSLVNHSFNQSQDQYFNKSDQNQDHLKQQKKINNQAILIKENEISYNQSIQQKSLNLKHQQYSDNFEVQNSMKQKSLGIGSEKQLSSRVKCPPSMSQHLSYLQNDYKDKQTQIQIPQRSQNCQVTMSQGEGLNTQKDIQDLKSQLETQRQILQTLQNQYMESQSIKFAESKILNGKSHIKSKSEQINFISELCKSPIKKVIITKRQYPAFSIIKQITPIRF